DPHVANEEYVDLNQATKNASLVLILCDHDEFKDLDYDLIKENMKNPIIFDTKNIIKEVPEDIKLYNYGNLYNIF
ncbi:UDP binding domain-containing protein, partial [Methanobrevibacter smithii]